MTEGRLRTGFSTRQILLLLMAVLIVYLVADFGRVVVANYRQRQDLQRVEERVLAAQQTNAALKARLEYSRSPQAVEEWSRLQGMARPNEQTFVLLGASAANAASASEVPAAPGAPAASNRFSWWELFFGDR